MRIPRLFIQDWLRNKYSLTLLRNFLRIRTVARNNSGYVKYGSAHLCGMSSALFYSTMAELVRLGLAVKVKQGIYKLPSIYRIMAEARKSCKTFKLDESFLQTNIAFKTWVHYTQVQRVGSRNSVKGFRAPLNAQYATSLVMEDMGVSRNTARVVQREGERLGLYTRERLLSPKSTNLVGYRYSVINRLCQSHTFKRFFFVTAYDSTGYEKVFNNYLSSRPEFKA